MLPALYSRLEVFTGQRRRNSIPEKARQTDGESNACGNLFTFYMGHQGFNIQIRKPIVVNQDLLKIHSVLHLISQP